MGTIWYHSKAKNIGFLLVHELYIYEIKFRKIICYEIITTHIVLSNLMWLHSFHISLKVPNSYDHLN